MCSNCSEVRDALGAAALPLNVATLYRKPSTLRDWLTGYKGDAEGSEPADPACLPPVRALLGRFLLEHGDTIAARAGGLDAIVVVPSTDRLPPHPLDAIIDSLRLDVPLLRSLARTTEPIGFRRPNPEAYAVTEAMRPGTRILIIYDVYTTGAHANSAASALRSASAHVAGLLVMPRRINPDYTPSATNFWATQSAQTFDWTRSPVLAARANG